MYCVPWVGASLSHSGRFQPLCQEMLLVSQDRSHYNLLYFFKHKLARLLASLFFLITGVCSLDGV